MKLKDKTDKELMTLYFQNKEEIKRLKPNIDSRIDMNDIKELNCLQKMVRYHMKRRKIY